MWVSLPLGLISMGFFALQMTTAEELVPTTIGMRPADCIHVSLEDEVILTPIAGKGVEAFYPKSGKTNFHEAKPHCIENAKQLMEIRSLKQDKLNAPVPVGDTSSQLGVSTWQDYAYFSTDPHTMGWFYGDYSVPMAPTKNDGQLLYFFTGMQNNDQSGVTIIQPVVSYCEMSGGCGAGQGNTLPEGWSMMATNCCPLGQTWYGPTKAINAGDTLSTVCSSNTTNVYVHMTDGSQHSTLNVKDSNRKFNWAAVTLEQYYVDTCPEYNAQAFNFTNLKLTDTSGTIVNPDWKTTVPNNGCGASVTVLDDGKTVEIAGTDR